MWICLIVVVVIASACGDGAVEPPVTTSICCATPDACYHGVETRSECERLSGVVGAPGTVCGGATGTCQPEPATTGPCCEAFEPPICLTGPELPLDPCVAVGGMAFPEGARCQPDGRCVAH